MSGGLLGGEYPDPGTPPDTSGGSGSPGGKVNTYPVPGGGRVISWQEPNPNYDPTQPDLMALYKISPYTTKTQYVADAAGTGAGGLSQNTAYSEQQQNARSAADLGEQQRQYNETFGYNKARGDQTQQLAEGNALGTFRGQPTLDAQKFGLDRDKFGFDQFKYLSDLKANPRNFMQQFDVIRGFNPSRGSADFGTNGNLPGYGLTPGGYSMPRFTQQQAAPSTAQTGMVRTGGTPVGPDTGYDNATEMSHTVYANSPENKERITSAVGGGQLPQRALGSVAFAHGGVVPEPVDGVGRISGKRYTFGERGPEGVVPSSYLPRFLQQRHGQAGRYALGGEIGFDAGTTDPYDPYKNDPSASTYGSTPAPGDPIIDTTQQPDPYGTGLSQGVNDAAFNANPYAPGDQNYIGPSAPTAPTNYSAPHQNEYVAPAAPQPFMPIDREPVSPLPPYVPPPAGPQQVIDRYYTPEQVGGTPIHPDVAPVQQPGFVPQGTTTAPPAVPGALTPRDVAAPGTFGNTIGTSGDSLSTFRSYLPKFLAGEDTPLANLVNQGTLPPFLGRIFAQQHGATEFGTNQPQRFNLPPDVPLISHIAYLQMSPSERSAFSSYLSSYGIEPNDYFDYVNSVSPQGPTAHDSLFGTPFSANIGQQ